MTTQNTTPPKAEARAEQNPRTVTKAYIRHYSDNGQTKAYIEWADGARTEGERNNLHMRELFKRTEREGITITRETW